MRLFPENPPPGPSEPDFWHSPLRGPWLTSFLGSLLLAAITAIAATGFLSHLAYAPDLGHNAIVPRSGSLDWLFVDWPTRPSWLYAFTQGVHVVIGFATVPLLLAKLWSVIPKLFEWPPLQGPLHALERVSLLLLVGSAGFQFATGVCNTQLYYPFHFNFVIAHFYGALIFVGALVLHVLTRLPVMRHAYATRGALKPLIDDLTPDGGNREPEDSALVAPVPEPPTLTRRGLLGVVGASSGALLVTTAGQSLGGPFRQIAVLAPRGGDFHFPVNKTAAVAKVTHDMVGASWRLKVHGPREVSLSRDQLLGMPLHTYSLPIACVEGWSSTQHWTGVRLRDLAEMAGVPRSHFAQVESLQPAGVLRQAALEPKQWHDERSLLALRVNGKDVSMDHGYPARIIVPGLPGVHNTKWVSEIFFHAT